MRILTNVLLCGALFTAAVSADEGMWTFDNPPTKLIQDKYNFTLTKQWLDHVRLSSCPVERRRLGIVRQPARTAADQSSRGPRPAAKELDAPSTTTSRTASTPPRRTEEMKSPDLEVNVLMSTEDVTARVQAAAEGRKRRRTASLRAPQDVIAEIERESQEKTGLRSDVVTLYQGGEYWLYRYKKYTDVRIVFAPEEQAAFFGGDPDNFTYPRYDLDMALFRVYENGKPIDTPELSEVEPQGRGRRRTGVRLRQSRLHGAPGYDGAARIRDAISSPDILKLLRAPHRPCSRNIRRPSPEQARQADHRDFRAGKLRQGARRRVRRA